MKALIVGINSFVGPFLAAHLSSCGYKVSGTYRTNVPDKDQLPETEFYKCHLNDYTQVESVLNAVKPDFIFNLAGFTSPFLSWQHPDKAFESNTTGVANLITASISICPKCRILLVSTGNLYNIQNGARITEQSPLTAKNPYAVSKLAAEQYALLMAEKALI